MSGPLIDQQALARLIDHQEIPHDDMLGLMRRIMSGEVPHAVLAALLIGLRVKRETVGEITAAAQVMREFSTQVEVADRRHLVDIVGTGGDGSHTCASRSAARVGRRPRVAPGSASTATAAFPASRAVPMFWKRSAPRSPCRPIASAAASPTPGWVSCLPPPIIRR